MNGDQFLRRLRKLARRRQVKLIVKPGKGDHLKIWFGDRMSVLPGRKEELRLGTFLAVLRDLGVSKDEFENER